MLEVAAPERAATYVAVLSLAVGPFRVLLPLAGALVVARFGYSVLFAAGALLTSISALALFALVSEPRHEPSNAASEKRRDIARG